MKFRALDFGYDAEAAAVMMMKHQSDVSTIIIPCGVVYERDRLWNPRNDDVNYAKKKRKHWTANEQQEQEPNDASRKIPKQRDKNDTPLTTGPRLVTDQRTDSLPITAAPTNDARNVEQESTCLVANESLARKQPIELPFNVTKHFIKRILESLHSQASTIRLTSLPWHDGLRVSSRPKETPKFKLYTSTTALHNRQNPFMSCRVGPSNFESAVQALGPKLRVVSLSSSSSHPITCRWLALMRGNEGFGRNIAAFRQKEQSLLDQPTTTAIVPYVPSSSFGARDILTLAVQIVMATMAHQGATTKEASVPNNKTFHHDEEAADEPCLESNDGFLSLENKVHDNDAKAKKKAKKEMRKKRRREKRRNEETYTEKNPPESKKQRKVKKPEMQQQADNADTKSPNVDETANKRFCNSDRLKPVDITKVGLKNRSGNRPIEESRKPRWVEGLRSTDDAGSMAQSNIERPIRLDAGGLLQESAKHLSVRVQQHRLNLLPSFAAKPVCELRFIAARRSIVDARGVSQDHRVNKSNQRSIESETSLSQLNTTGFVRHYARSEVAGAKHALLAGRRENLSGNKPLPNSGTASVPKNAHPVEDARHGASRGEQRDVDDKIIHTQRTYQALEPCQNERCTTVVDQRTKPKCSLQPHCYEQHRLRAQVTAEAMIKRRPSVFSENQNEQISQSVTERKPSGSKQESTSTRNMCKESNHACQRSNSTIMINSFRKSARARQPAKQQPPSMAFQPHEPRGGTEVARSPAVQRHDYRVDGSNSMSDEKQASYYKWAVADPDPTEIPATPTVTVDVQPRTSNVSAMCKIQEPIPTQAYVRCLCSESFLESNPEIVVALAAGTRDRTTEGSSLPPVSLVDTTLLAQCRVDIETPDQRGIVIRRASQISTPGGAKDTILFLVELAAMHRYDRITVFIVLDIQNSDAMPIYLTKIHCAMSGQHDRGLSKVAVIPIPPGNVSSAIAKLVLRKPAPEQASLNEQAVELITAANFLAIDRASFLLDLMPSLTAYMALQCLLLLDQMRDHGAVGGFAALFTDHMLLHQVIFNITGKHTVNRMPPPTMTHLLRLLQAQL
jgi:hypothetical protein